VPAHQAQPDHPAALMSASSASLADLIQKLACLETRIVTLQEQIAQLALALLQERERTVESRIAALESFVHPLVGRHTLPDLQEQGAGQASACASPQERRLLPAEQRARARMPALIEYGAQGTYVIITSQEGELPPAPDTAEWFEWLATISSFRFVGQQGRFTAYRDTKHASPTRSWRAYRTIHQRNYKCSLGVTDGLTLACLEQAAATLHAHVPSLYAGELCYGVTSLCFQTSATVVVCIGGNYFDGRGRQTIQKLRKSHKYPVEQAVSAVRFM